MIICLSLALNTAVICVCLHFLSNTYRRHDIHCLSIAVPIVAVICIYLLILSHVTYGYELYFLSLAKPLAVALIVAFP